MPLRRGPDRDVDDDLVTIHYGQISLRTPGREAFLASLPPVERTSTILIAAQGAPQQQQQGRHEHDEKAFAGDRAVAATHLALRR